MTSLCGSPRIGSSHTKTGLSTQSERSPVACWVLEPSKPQIGGSSPSWDDLALRAQLVHVGWVPSTQMYSAL